jgi:hypothetical protein
MSANTIAYYTPRADGWHVYFGRMARLAGVFQTPDEAEAETERLNAEWRAGRLTSDGEERQPVATGT